MRFSDWSSDVCSSDLPVPTRRPRGRPEEMNVQAREFPHPAGESRRDDPGPPAVRGPGGGDDGGGVAGIPPAVSLDPAERRREDRKSLVEGKRVSVRVDLGCRRYINKKKITEPN